MEKKKVLVWGTSDNCLARCVRCIDFDKVEIVAFVDSKECSINITKGNKYCTVKREYVFWPFDKIRVISPKQIEDTEFDFLLISSLVYAQQIYDTITKEINIKKEQVLLIPDEVYNAAFYDIGQYGNNEKNAEIFINDYYNAILKYNETVHRGTDEKNGIICLKGLKFPLDVFMHDRKSTWHEMNDILQKHIWENELFEYVEGPYEFDKVVIEDGDIIFDCGANIGLFTGLASEKTPNGKVYAFEPVEEVRDMLMETSKYYSNIVVMDTALSDTEGTIQMAYDKDNCMGGSIVSDKGDGNITVKVDTIDHFVTVHNIEKVDFIKADIEGAERNMIKGARNTLKKYAPKIAICTYHLKDDKEVLEQLIKEANPNYIVVHKWLKLFAYVPDKSRR
ncbi:MAG: FkbM family methyltransferase [Lachnospiraceae bacterium]|nr:FkbM family methyltransferase [Lachnospiraceae bacterium]